MAAAGNDLPARRAPPGTVRLFFAAWPEPGVQRVLGEIAAAAQKQCGGRPVPVHNIHLTLVFLGNVERERLAEIEAAAARVEASAFALSLDRLDYWRHNRIVWAGVELCPQPLRELVAALERALAGCGFRFERRPYVPHVTLLRNARRAPERAPLPPIAWAVADFALVESVQLEGTTLYEVLQRWPLAGAAAAAMGAV